MQQPDVGEVILYLPQGVEDGLLISGCLLVVSGPRVGKVCVTLASIEQRQVQHGPGQRPQQKCFAGPLEQLSQGVAFVSCRTGQRQ
ncbi:hypothetical protein D3C78_1060620 [compost metagenome]